MLNHILKTSIFIGFIFTHSFNAIASVADSESCALPSFHKTAHSVYKLTNTGFETVLNANSSVIRVDFLSFGRLANQNPIPTFKLVEQRMSKALYQAGANIFLEFLKENDKKNLFLLYEFSFFFHSL